MNLKTTPICAKDSPAQEMTVMLNGRMYTVCSPGQMCFVEEGLKDQLRKETPEITEEKLKEGLETLKLTCGYATIGWLLSKMTPEQQKAWKYQYRFGGTWQCKPK